MKVSELFDHWEDIETHASGAVIFSEENQPQMLYVILSGEVEFSLNGERIGCDSKGGIIGEMSIIESSPSYPVVKALSDVRLARMDKQEFGRMMTQYPEFGHHAMEVMANRLRSVNEFISNKLGSIKK